MFGKIFIRRLSTSSIWRSQERVRVRFAPSPTGEMHLGGLRTALYNYLFARKHGDLGDFILRIEDTDQSRLVPGATERLIDVLRWVGLTPDEGPTIGGKYGPYIQSERLELYREAANQLVESGAAYRCFCTDHRLELVRKDAARRRQIPKYDNRCRHLTDEEIRDFMAKDTPFVIRFKLLEGPLSFHDIVYKNITLDLSETEGDFVILKSDGYPTYHLANVVDDNFMQISHVLRGVEWQISTPKHLQMFQALGWQPPRYAHLPLMVNQDGTKLSKRNKGFMCENLRQDNYLTDTVINFLLSSGGGLGKATNDFHTLEEFVDKFNLESLNTNPCRVNLERLSDFNKLTIINSDESKLLDRVHEIVSEKYPDASKDYISNVFRANKHRLNFLEDIVGEKFQFLWVELPKEKIVPDDQRKVFLYLIAELEKLPAFSKKELTNFLKCFHEENIDTSFKDFMGSLRYLISGLKEGPGVAEMMEMLGKEKCLSRISRTI